MSEQMQYAIMEWPTDGGRVSVHHLKYILEPQKSWNLYEVGDKGKAKFGKTGEWEFVIHAVGPTSASLQDKLRNIAIQLGQPGTDASETEAVIEEKGTTPAIKETNKQQNKDDDRQTAGKNRKTATAENVLQTEDEDRQTAETAGKKRKTDAENVLQTEDDDRQTAETAGKKTKTAAENTSLLKQRSQKHLAETVLKKCRESSEESLTHMKDDARTAVSVSTEKSPASAVAELREELRKLKRRVRELERARDSERTLQSLLTLPSPKSSLPSLPSVSYTDQPSPQFTLPSLTPVSYTDQPSPQFTLPSPPSVNYTDQPSLQSMPPYSPVEPVMQTVNGIASGQYNGHSIDSLQDCICHFDSLFECCHVLLLKLFSVEYLLSHSVTGQRPNPSTPAKSKFDLRLYGVFCAVVRRKFPNVRDKDITLKVHAVQKKYKKKQ